MTGKLPPPHVQRGAADVQHWLDQQNPTRKSPAEIAQMSWAERLDYTRAASAARKMPDWCDPRDPRGHGR
jgi:hypothetical protein